MSDAITRKETLLKSIANGTSSALKPITREEQYLAYIAGESKSFPTTPITREEAFLDKIAKKGAGGGGSSINVQPLNATANGTYDAPEGQAYDPVTVDVKPITEPITITENGVYPVPKGGSLVEGETYTFKNDLNDIDPSGFMKTPNPEAPGMMYSIALLGESTMLCYLTAQGVAAMFGGDFETDMWLYISGADGITYMYPRKIKDGDNIIDNNAGWGKTTGGSMPEISVTIPSPFDASVGGYSLEEIAVFFDIETKSLDGWGDITVNVSASGGESKAIPEFDKFAMFKSTITKEDFEEYLSKANLIAENEYQKSALLCIDKAGFPWAINVYLDENGEAVTYMLCGQMRMYVWENGEGGWGERISTSVYPLNDRDTFAIPSSDTSASGYDSGMEVETVTVQDMGTALADTYMFFEDANVISAPPNIYCKGTELTIADATQGAEQIEYWLYGGGGDRFATIEKTADVQKVDLTAYNVSDTQGYSVAYMTVKKVVRSYASSNTRYNTPST